MKVVVSSRGSRGDVMPLVAIATRLARRGQDVTVCLPQTFEGEARARGLARRIYPEDSHDLMVGMGVVWAAMKNALAWFARDVEAQLELLLEACAGADALVTSVNEIAAPTAAERLGLRHDRVAYAPGAPGRSAAAAHPLAAAAAAGQPGGLAGDQRRRGRGPGDREHPASARERPAGAARPREDRLSRTF